MTKVFYDGPDHRVGKVVSRLSRKDMTLFTHAKCKNCNFTYSSTSSSVSHGILNLLNEVGM